MEENSVFVVLYISPADAVRACSPKSGDIKVRLSKEDLESLTEEERAALAQSSALCSSGSSFSLKGACTPDLAGVKQALAYHREKEQQEEARREQLRRDAIDRVLQAPLADLISKTHSWDFYTLELSGLWGYYNVGSIYAHITDAPEVQARLAEAQAVIEAHNAEVHTKRAQAKQCKEAEERAAEEKRKAENAAEAERTRLYHEALAEMVRQRGTDSQRERLAVKNERMLGALPIDEAEDLVRSEYFEVFKGIPPYEKIKTAEVLALVSDEYPDLDKVDFDVTTISTFNDAQWGALSVFKQRAAKSGIEMTFKCQRHTGTYEDEALVERYSVKVEFDWHGKKFHKTFAL